MECDKRGIDICVLPRIYTAKVYSHTLYVCNFSFIHFVALLSPPCIHLLLLPLLGLSFKSATCEAYFIHAPICAQLREILIAVAVYVAFVIVMRFLE